jgi:hypothetical protein
VVQVEGTRDGCEGVPWGRVLVVGAHAADVSKGGIGICGHVRVHFAGFEVALAQEVGGEGVAGAGGEEGEDGTEEGGGGGDEVGGEGGGGERAGEGKETVSGGQRGDVIQVQSRAGDRRADLLQGMVTRGKD